MLNSLLDIFRHRILIVTFARRILKMRFLASALGVFWIIATPIMLVIRNAGRRKVRWHSVSAHV